MPQTTTWPRRRGGGATPPPRRPVRNTIASFLLPLAALVIGSGVASAQSKDLGNGFVDHGVCSPMSNHRGTVATVDGEGRNVVLSWLFDHRGGYALLMIDAATGKAEQFPMPFPAGDAAFSSLLSSDNKFYTHFNSHFCVFDPVQRKFTFSRKTTPQMAMSFTEAEDGVIWSVTYPDSGVASFDPKTRELTDYGSVYQQNWKQYPRHVAVGDDGWVYFAVGNTATQIVAFEPKSRKATPLLDGDDRKTGMAYVVRDVSGKIYGQNLSGASGTWYELSNGLAKRIDQPKVTPKPMITGTQGLFHTAFPDGSRLKTLDLLERKLTVQDKAGKSAVLPFDYASEGAGVMGVDVSPDGTVSGGTWFPMRSFSYDPKADKWANRQAYGQFNAVARQGDRYFFGGYPNGFLLEWDPGKPWKDTVKDSKVCNPVFIAACSPTIHRPHKLLAHPDGKTIVLAGTPAYGHTGGGLYFWDRQASEGTLLTHEQILRDHSTGSLVALPDGKLLGGTTTAAGTGGEQKAREAVLYLMDMATKKLEWHEPIIPGAQWYTDMTMTASGLVYGVVDRRVFFVFDPAQRAMVHQFDLEPSLGQTSFEQAPRVFVAGPGDAMYMMLARGVARVDPKTYEVRLVAKSPVKIDAGGVYFDGRIYFAGGSHLYSWKVE